MASSLTRVARSSVLLASRASPVRTLGARTIVVGRDGRHWNSVLLMVPQAEEWQIEQSPGVRPRHRRVVVTHPLRAQALRQI